MRDDRNKLNKNIREIRGKKRNEYSCAREFAPVYYASVMEGISVSENNQMTLDRTKVSEEDK